MNVFITTLYFYELTFIFSLPLIHHLYLQEGDDDKEALLAREYEYREQMQAQTQIVESEVELIREREDRIQQLEVR